jgi:hypothetical protein
MILREWGTGMITKLALRNFKSVSEQTYEFTQFDLLAGRNNSGKSTVLQALAIWQFCVDEFHRSKRAGSKGIQVVLPNFTALPVPEFNLLEGPYRSLLARGRWQEEAGIHPDPHRRGMEAGDRHDSHVWRGITLSLVTNDIRDTERWLGKVPRP